MMGMGMPMGYGMPGPVPAAPPAEAPKEEAPKEEPKIIISGYQVKIKSYTAEGKVRVIKEVRAFNPSLSLVQVRWLWAGCFFDTVCDIRQKTLWKQHQRQSSIKVVTKKRQRL